MNIIQKPALTKSQELTSLGAKFHGEGKIGEAYLHYLAAITADVNNPLAWSNLSAALLVMDKYDAAIVAAKKAINLDPTDANIKGNLAVGYLGSKRFTEAIVTLGEIEEEKKDNSHYWHNYALTMSICERYNEALAAYNTSLELNNNSNLVHSDRAMTKLAVEDIIGGLEEYEVRWKILTKSKVWDLGIKEWQGENIDGKQILIHHEQGFGDSLMLVRFINQVNGFAFVTLAVPGPLVRLFKANFPLINIIDLESNIDGKHYHFHSPMLSLLRWLNIDNVNKIDSTPYLHKTGSDIKFNLPNAKNKIGLCWASGDHGRALIRRRRNIGLNLFLPLIELPDVALISLQKGPNENDVENVGGLGIIYNNMSRIEDFADTAEIISQLDLVISVDSAVAHLAGAMGKPVLMLGPYPRCWRWWNGTNGLPWYNNFEIFQQDPDGSWIDTVKAVIYHVKKEMNYGNSN